MPDIINVITQNIRSAQWIFFSPKYLTPCKVLFSEYSENNAHAATFLLPYLICFLKPCSDSLSLASYILRDLIPSTVKLFPFGSIFYVGSWKQLWYYLKFLLLLNGKSLLKYGCSIYENLIYFKLVIWELSFLEFSTIYEKPWNSRFE